LIVAPEGGTPARFRDDSVLDRGRREGFRELRDRQVLERGAAPAIPDDCLTIHDEPSRFGAESSARRRGSNPAACDGEVPNRHRRGLGRVITSGGRLVGTRGGVGGVVGTVVGRGVGGGGVFGTAVPPSFGSFVPALPIGGVTAIGGAGAGGILVAGLNAAVVWQSAQVVGNVAWPG
jgi:hypothetical protein